MKKLNKLHKSRSYLDSVKYISSLRNVSWFKYTFFVMMLSCALIDYVNIAELFQVVMDTPDMYLQNSFYGILVYLKPLLFSLLITAVIVICPITIGKFIGIRKIQGRRKLYDIFSISMFFVIFLFVLSLIWFRYIIEANHALWVYEDPIIFPIAITAIYGAIMIAGIIVSILYGYFNKNYYSKVVKES